MDITVDAPVDEKLLAVAVRRTLRTTVRRIRVAAAVLLVMAGLFVVLGFYSGAGPSYPALLAVLATVFAVIAPRQLAWSTMRSLRQVPELSQNRRPRITEAGLRSVSPLVDVSYAWEAFAGFQEIPGAVLLRAGRGFVLVPTWNLPADQPQLLQDFLSRRLPAAP